jgi:hypothetical protein
MQGLHPEHGEPGLALCALAGSGRKESMVTLVVALGFQGPCNTSENVLVI